MSWKKGRGSGQFRSADRLSVRAVGFQPAGSVDALTRCKSFWQQILGKFGRLVLTPAFFRSAFVHVLFETAGAGWFDSRLLGPGLADNRAHVGEKVLT